MKKKFISQEAEKSKVKISGKGFTSSSEMMLFFLHPDNVDSRVKGLS